MSSIQDPTGSPLNGLSCRSEPAAEAAGTNRRVGSHDAYMSLDPRMADFLAACKSWKRRFYFAFEEPLLRKGNSPKAKKRRRAQEEAIRAEIKNELDRQGRRMFRGHVSVSLAIFGGEPEIPTIVKAYLDCFEGILYPDDRAVGHLLVSRWGPGDDNEKVYFNIEPLSIYVASFDHVFTSRHQLEAADECFWVDDAPAWGNPFGAYDQMEATRLEREIGRHRDDEDDAHEDELADFDRIELAEMLRSSKESSLAALRLKEVLDQPLHYLDRPGRPPAWTNPLLTADPALDLARSPDDRGHPGTFWLPPPGSSGWSDTVTRELWKRRADWRLLGTPIKRAIGLDIAVQQLQPPGKDLDNLAHEILVPFEEVFGDGQRRLVQLYRVYGYGRHGSRPGVRVRLMERHRLEATHRLIEDAHLERLQPALD